MKTFAINLHDATRSETITDARAFVGEDFSGRFGIMANHARMMTTLVFGLARYRKVDGVWQYLALPGALLYFDNNTLTVTARRYLRDDNYLRISSALKQQLLDEEKNLKTIKQSLHRMEEELLKRMWELRRHGT